MKKRRVSLSVARSTAWGSGSCPSSLERATQNPRWCRDIIPPVLHPRHNMTVCGTEHGDIIQITSHEHLLLLCWETGYWNCQISSGQWTKRPVNASLYRAVSVMVSRQEPTFVLASKKWGSGQLSVSVCCGRFRENSSSWIVWEPMQMYVF